MEQLQEITFDDFKNHLGKDIVMKLKDKEDRVKLVSVKDETFSVKITTNNKWNGIEPHYRKPTNSDIKFYLA